MKSNLNLLQESVPIELYQDKKWIVAHTRARQEKKLAEFLIMKGITCYLPLTVNVSRASNRTRYYENPLFAGYLFLACQPEEKGLVLVSSCISTLIPVPDQEELVTQLHSIQTALIHAKCVKPCDDIDAGTRVRFKKGPLAGIEGMIIRRKNLFRIVLTISILRRTVEVEADIEDVEPIED